MRVDTGSAGTAKRVGTEVGQGTYFTWVIKKVRDSFRENLSL